MATCNRLSATEFPRQWGNACGPPFTTIRTINVHAYLWRNNEIRFGQGHMAYVSFFPLSLFLVRTRFSFMNRPLCVCVVTPPPCIPLSIDRATIPRSMIILFLVNETEGSGNQEEVKRGREGTLNVSLFPSLSRITTWC